MERLFNKPLDIIINETVCKPIGLKKVSYRPCKTSQGNIVVTTFERPNRGSLEEGIVHDGNAFAINKGIAGNAGLFASADEVATFGQSFLTNTLLNSSLIHEMTSLQSEYEGKRRGLGWQLHDENSFGSVFSQRSFGHSGFTGTSLWIDPEMDIVISFLTNSVHFYRSTIDIERFGLFRKKIHEIIFHELKR